MPLSSATKACRCLSTHLLPGVVKSWPAGTELPVRLVETSIWAALRWWNRRKTLNALSRCSPRSLQVWTEQRGVTWCGRFAPSDGVAVKVWLEVGARLVLKNGRTGRNSVRYGLAMIPGVQAALALARWNMLPGYTGTLAVRRQTYSQMARVPMLQMVSYLPGFSETNCCISMKPVTGCSLTMLRAGCQQIQGKKSRPLKRQFSVFATRRHSNSKTG